MTQDDESAGPERFDTKVAVLLRDDLAVWQQLNVTGFLISGIAASIEDITGEPYMDADGTQYLPMLRMPITVLEGDAAVLTSAHRRALDRDLRVAVYTEELFSTPNDTANRAAGRAVPRDQLQFLVLGVYRLIGDVYKAV